MDKQKFLKSLKFLKMENNSKKNENYQLSGHCLSRHVPVKVKHENVIYFSEKILFFNL